MSENTRILLENTLLSALVAVALASPIGILAAVYTSEFTGRSMRRVIDPAVRILAAVPSIVYGYAALVTVVPVLMRAMPRLDKLDVMVAGVAMAVMLVPVVLCRGHEALGAVPQTLRDAARALGAGRMATVVQVILPAARTRILATVLFAASRAVSETVLVLVVLAVLLPGQTSLGHIDALASFFTTNLAGRDGGSFELQAVHVVGIALVVLAFAFDVAHVRLATPFRRDT